MAPIRGKPRRDSRAFVTDSVAGRVRQGAHARGQKIARRLVTSEATALKAEAIRPLGTRETLVGSTGS
jgi:hypothetical protein